MSQDQIFDPQDDEEPWRDQNPIARSSIHDPWRDEVRATKRPEQFQQLLSNSDFAFPGWSTHFIAERFFYLDGVRSALRLFQTDSTAFLKTEGFIDEALRQEQITQDWSRQSGVRLTMPISLPRTRSIKEAKPTHFQKCVVCMVAFELAIERKVSNISPLWAYDYLRVVPAVYNIRGFTPEKLKSLRAHYRAFDSDIVQYARLADIEVLTDLSTGKTVTRSTAIRIKLFVDEHCRDDQSHAVGEVRLQPGDQGLGIGPASEHDMA
jgi:hypothetical protein